MFILSLATTIITILILWQIYDWIKASRKAKEEPKPMAAIADPIGLADLTAKLKAWMESLGMDIKQINAEIDQIKAFAAIVLIQPHVLEVVSADKQAEITAAFTAIKTAIGIDVVVTK